MVRAKIGLIAAMVTAIALAGCGGTSDPYAVLDQARAASYERIQLNLGLEVTVPPSDLGGELQNAGMTITMDPTWVTAALDTSLGRAYLRLAIPLNQMGLPPEALRALPVNSVDFEALLDANDVYVKSPLLPLAFPNGIAGVPIEGDLTGWVRFNGAGALGPMLPLLLGGGVFGGGQGFDLPELPLPSPGNVTALKDFLTEIGATVEYAGSESLNGAELHHLKGGLRIATLAGSQPFQTLTGMSREQVQSMISELEGKVGISTEIWVNKSTGRLTTLRIDGTNAETPATKVAVILRIADPGADITFEPPTTFTDIDISDLMGNQFPGVGIDGGVNAGQGGMNAGGGVVGMVTPAPMQPEAPTAP